MLRDSQKQATVKHSYDHVIPKNLKLNDHDQVVKRRSSSSSGMKGPNPNIFTIEEKVILNKSSKSDAKSLYSFKIFKKKSLFNKMKSVEAPVINF